MKAEDNAAATATAAVAEALGNPQTEFTKLETPRGAAGGASFAASTAAREHPLDSTNYLSSLTIWWLQPLLKRGYHAPLEDRDVWDLPKSDQARVMQATFDTAWSNEAQRAARRAKTPQFGRALWKTTQRTMNTAIAALLMSSVFMVVQPMLIKAVLQYLQDEENMFGITSGYTLAALILCTALLNGTCINNGMFLSARAGCTARMIVVNSVYQKLLQLSATARRTMNSGEIVTLASVDSERIIEAYNIGLWAIVSPLTMLASAILIGTQMNFYVGLAALAIIVLIVYSGTNTAQKVGDFRRRIAKVSAERIKVTNEVLQGIRVVKFYGWEDSIAEKIRGIRDQEIALMRTYNYLRLYNSVLMIIAPVVVNAVCFLVYVLMGNRLDVPTAFVVLALANSTKMPFAIFANATICVSEAFTSAKRVSNFLVADQVIKRTTTDITTTEPCISITDGDFQWLADADQPTLSSINLSLQPGSLTVIVGSVGSGKSSLVNAILGEMHQTAGQRVVNGKFAYSSQQPWIQNQTLRENILFGEEFDRVHYDNVVAACELQKDFGMLEHGDATEIGERGINLSGGQKARVGIARAMYRVRRSDFLVLDDPLSALDVHVANAVFKNGLNGLARNKTRLLVLNSHYHFLPSANRVIVMADGQILGDGTFTELQPLFPFLGTSPKASDAEAANEKADDKEDSNDQQVAAASTSKTSEEGNKKTLIQAEDRMVGVVGARTYVKYFNSSGWNGMVVAISLLLLFAATQVALFFVDWFMSRWARGSFALGQKTSVGIYWAIVVVATILAFGRSVLYTEVCMRCSANMHSKYIRKVFAAPVTTFFDVTPVGRILNRFSRDLDQMDNPFPYFSLWMFSYVSQVISVFIVCAATNAYITITYIPVLVVFLFVARYYQASARELKRLDGITRSPFINLVTETIHGIETIRSFGMSAAFSQRCETLLNHNGKFFFEFQAASRWFAMRADWLVGLVIGTVAFLSIATKSSVGAAMSGLALTYSSQLTSFFQRTMTLVTMTESLMTCFERIAHYETLEEEGHRNQHRVQQPPPQWPTTGVVQFENVSMRYRDDLELVLKEVSFSVGSGEKVGVCGRTGSGKSSLMSVLFRIVEVANGRVLIDGVDIATLPLQALRAKLTIVPQDPMLFSGSLRMNLDPFGEKDDHELWEVLRKVHLADAVSAMEGGLQFEVAEKGDNLSVGQRQLLCIARALIRQSKVVVMDEATANVDQEADKLIQRTVQESFGGGKTTVLCIAHRLETIMDSDKILVLDAGRVQEFDSPAALVQRDGLFQSLVASSRAVGRME
ncbi:TPA: hypothetical protein N0F65_004040 [Lagenidium giganteum]|uniref:ABC transporter n=1 Tax=Lagenidium giganteum TaxID=4803 RepID=A0AAV2YI23_9STRA|nr:TPA: hypothetical protein N0F65_004040 [Lagenidium giganteum]